MMIVEEIKQEADTRMGKSLVSLEVAFAKIRTGRAHPSLLDSISVDYYGTMTQLKQIANINVEDGRSLIVAPWERPMIPLIEKAIHKSDLGLNPSSGGESIRIPMPPLTEENRRDLAKIARSEAEGARISIRNIRRDANNDVKDFLKEKEISEDEARRGEDQIQKLTDSHIKAVDKALEAKEADLMEL
jgi:ribosome recycling factor